MEGEVLSSEVIGKIKAQKIRKEKNPPFSPYSFHSENTRLQLRTACFSIKDATQTKKDYCCLKTAVL